MPPLAYTALTASIILSALGAVVICLLTAFYGFTPEGEELPARASRRTLLTRVGHAVAAACFAGTAILLAVVVGQPARSTSAPAADVRVPALDAKIDAQIQRLHGVERRMKDSEQTLERLETAVADATARRMGPEAAVTDAPAKSEDKPVPAAKAAPRSRAAMTAAKPPAPSAAKPPAPSAAKPADRPGTVTLPAERPAAVTAPPPPISAPAERAFAPKPIDEPAASPGPPPAATAPAPPPSSTTPAPRSSESSPMANDFRSKFQNDWRAIQRGWDRAADDFRRALAPLTGN